MNDYNTVQNEDSAEFTEKRSRFIASVCPVSTEKEALSFLEKIRKKYPDARHNVYAYTVRENNIQRFSDDGEPSGTAGIPTLETIKKRGLTDVAVIVTRYFGGILLGGGGLLRAYSHAASIGLDAANPVTMRYCLIYSVKTDYHLLGKVEYELRSLGLTSENAEYGADVKLDVCVLPEKCEQFISALTDATGGRVSLLKKDEKYVACKMEEKNG